MNHLQRWTRTLTAALASLIWAGWALAQETTTDVTTTTTTTTWYEQGWVWIVGVAVFLIVVIALTNRGGRTSA